MSMASASLSVVRRSRSGDVGEAIDSSRAVLPDISGRAIQPIGRSASSMRRR